MAFGYLKKSILHGESGITLSFANVWQYDVIAIKSCLISDGIFPACTSAAKRLLMSLMQFDLESVRKTGKVVTMSMKKQGRGWIMVLAVVFMMLIGAGGAMGGTIQAFTADNVMLGADGQIKSVSKLYFSHDKMRSDMGMRSQKMRMGKLTVIYRRDKQQLWMLNPEKKIYVQMPLDEKKWEQDAKGMIKSEKAKVLGTENVNGYRCTKKKVTRRMEMMGMNMTTTQTIWVSDKMDMPLRVRSHDGTVTELRNIKKGNPSAGVFEIPPGYKKVGDNMMALMMATDGKKLPAAEPSEDQKSGGMKLPFGTSH
ncbi:MAG TPA: DUF4412 domain-containing protein [Desulfobulbaceae bacterium]|nr:DUF4412 domain-containing protein [Desulfobulbaceae bacterium]